MFATENGREVHYSFDERQRQPDVRVVATVDRMAIDGAAQVGGVGQVDEGWTVYGVPASLKRRLRPRLKKECMDASGRVNEVIEKEADRFIKSLVRKARGRLPAKELDRAEKALWSALVGARMYGGLTFLYTYMNEAAPGMLPTLTGYLQADMPDREEAQIRWYARTTGTSELAVERAVKAYRNRTAASRRLFQALPPHMAEAAAQELRALMAVVASWCAVIR